MRVYDRKGRRIDSCLSVVKLVGSTLKRLETRDNFKSSVSISYCYIYIYYLLKFIMAGINLYTYYLMFSVIDDFPIAFKINKLHK